MITNKAKPVNISIYLFLIFFILALTSLSITSCSKPEAYRVGILAGLTAFSETADNFMLRMNELGYIENKDIIYFVHTVDFDMTAYNQILNNFIKDDIDLIFVYPTEAAMQAKVLTKNTDIPVIFANAYTEGTGLVDSLQKPGGNITGVRWPGPEIITKSVNVMEELSPKIKRILVFYQKDYPIVQSQLEVLKTTTVSKNINLLAIPANNGKELEREIQKINGPFDETVVLLIAEPLLTTPEGFSPVSDFAAKHSILMGGTAIFVGSYQSVFALAPDYAFQGEMAANMADKVLKGNPADTIIVNTSPSLFTINYAQAVKNGLKINEKLLSQADIIIR